MTSQEFNAGRANFFKKQRDALENGLLVPCVMPPSREDWITARMDHIGEKLNNLQNAIINAEKTHNISTPW
jgi:hypothetical protein